jgi:hypothetical protein
LLPYTDLMREDPSKWMIVAIMIIAATAVGIWIGKGGI